MKIGNGATVGLVQPAPVAALTDVVPPFAIEFLPPPAGIAAYVTAFFSVRCDLPQISDVLPSTIAMLMVFLNGRGQLQLRNGHAFDSHCTNLITPLSDAARFVVEGPWNAFGATITPLGWAALTRGMSAAQWGNRMVDAELLLGPEITRLGHQLTLRHRAGKRDVARMVEMTARVLADRAMPVAARHADAIAAVTDWLGTSLSPRVEDLAARTPYSVRQMQRLVDHYFGLSPKQLARKYRALRAAALLGHPDTPADLIAHVEEQFYDQSHMIREIRVFTGCTPGRLALMDKPVMAASLEWRYFYQIAPMPPGMGF